MAIQVPDGGAAMKAIVIYDSLYGNTEQIAQAIGGGIEGEVKVVKVGEVEPEELGSMNSQGGQ